MVSLSDIKKFFRGHIAINEPLSRYVSMKVGGPVDYFIEPADAQDLVAIVRHFQGNNFRFMMIGRGSNLLVSDEGIRGAAVSLEEGLSDVRLEGDIVVAESGARMTKLVDFCIQNGLAGMEWAAGIPGTVGGGIIMNAGAHGGQLSDHLIDVQVLREGELRTIAREQGEFSYRRSGFQRDVVFSGRFHFPPGNKEELARRRSELMKIRNANQPLNLPNSGSMFKNPSGTFAAKLIEQAGLKGKRVGNAQISDKHANFIVNLGGAKAADIITLLELARRTVYQNTGILLDLEVKLIGFPDETLRKFE
ncbi:MAG: UDP-N-acetylmuramate dehydrogenase [Bacteroidota bacterium]